MASFNNGRASSSTSTSASFDALFLQSLMGNLQLGTPSVDANSILSLGLDEFLLGNLPYQLDDDADESPYGGGRERSLLAKEEAKLEKEIIRIIHAGDAQDKLKPNSSQSVAIGDHHICVGFHEEPNKGYRAWEWHGHIMLFDEENGYSPEYIYGNYFERLANSGRKDPKNDEEEEEEEVEEEEEEGEQKGSGNSGLKDLVGDAKDSVGSGGLRVLHRNSLNKGSSR